jgi:beta-glucosidase
MVMVEGKKYHFPKSFLWGASVSTHQVEGGNHNQWSVWELENAQVSAAKAPYRLGHLKNWEDIKVAASDPSNYVSGRAADHYNKYEQDFILARQLNLNAMRSGIEWSRIEPEEGKFNSEALNHYRDYFAKMKKQGMQPVVTLWHWTTPVWFAEKGGFKRLSNIKYFERFVKYLVENAPELFDGYVITLNEPTVYALYGYRQGLWPPQEQSLIAMHTVLVNLARAHRRAYKLIKKIRPKAKIGLAHNCAYFYAGDSSVISKISAWAADIMGNRYFINLVKSKQDFLGLNYYFANEMHGTNVHNPFKKVSDLGWDLQPDKLGPLLSRLSSKYKLPLMITESGVADSQDKLRTWWIEESIKSITRAMDDGSEVIGYIHWSLLDNFEWAEGFWPRFGLIEVNYKTMQRKIRPSAKIYSALIRTQQK